MSSCQSHLIKLSMTGVLSTTASGTADKQPSNRCSYLYGQCMQPAMRGLHQKGGRCSRYGADITKHGPPLSVFISVSISVRPPCPCLRSDVSPHMQTPSAQSPTTAYHPHTSDLPGAFHSHPSNKDKPLQNSDTRPQTSQENSLYQLIPLISLQS